MRDEIELQVNEDGTLTAMYSESIVKLAKDMGGKISDVGRVSVVEWNKSLGGWTVESVKDPELCMRRDGRGQPFLSRSGSVMVFETREEAIKLERQFFWQLLG